MVYEIDGYWKDDKSEFSGYLVSEMDCTPDGYEDDDIFFFGMSENVLADAVKRGEDTVHDFVVTAYREVG